MRIPKRRGEEERAALAEPMDRYLTSEKIARLKRELENLVSRERGEAAAEVRRLAEMGDFSENAGYQIAKATLRRINSRIDSLKERIKVAIPIESGPDDQGRVRIGSTVVLTTGDKQLTFEILGSQETSPSAGRISHLSPLGAALLGRKIADEVTVAETTYRLQEIR